MRAFLSVALIALATAVLPAGKAVCVDNQPGKVNVTILGKDGKPAKGGKASEAKIGSERDGMGNPIESNTKGRVVLIHSRDDAGNEYHTAIYVPDGKEIDMTARLGPSVDPYGAHNKAMKAKQQGDTATYEKAYNDLKYSTAEIERVTAETQNAIEEWARDNGLPKLTLKQINKQLKAAETVGANNQSKEAVENLKAYQSKLVALEDMLDNVTFHKERLAALTPPEKKTSMLPSTCPDGQSGGLLAGLINSATGTNSVDGICGETPEKDNKDHTHGGETHGKD